MKRCAHFPRRDAERLTGHEGVALVSIRHPGTPRPSFRNPWASVLYLEFHDTDDTSDPHAPNAKHARDIAGFIRVNRERSIYAHCEAGVSRSAAVCEALVRMGWDYWKATPYSRELANPLLLRLLVAELGLGPR